MTECSWVFSSSSCPDSTSFSPMACCRPAFRASPPVISTGEVAFTEASSFTRRWATDRWIPLRMSPVATPRLTMLITSVSARTAQMPDGCSGCAAWTDREPTSASGTPR